MCVCVCVCVCVCLWEVAGWVGPLEPECLGWNLGLPIFQLCDSKSDSQMKSGNNIIVLRIVKHHNQKKLKISLYYCHETRRKTLKKLHLNNKQGRDFMGFVGELGDVWRVFEKSRSSEHGDPSTISINSIKSVY